MPAYIMEHCIICGTCWDICPKAAVEEFQDYYRITNKCDDCGECLKACPNCAIAITESRGKKLEKKINAEVDAAND